MRLPVLNDKGRIRWAVIPDDCAGALDYPVPMREIIRRRAEIVVAVFSATHGVQGVFPYIRNAFKIQKCDMISIIATGQTRPALFESLELAFAAAVNRVRLIEQAQNGGRPPKKNDERTEAGARDSAGRTGEDDEAATMEAPPLHGGPLRELREGGSLRAEPHPLHGVFGDPEGEDASADGGGPSQPPEQIV